MNRRILGISIAVLTIAILTSPVAAIGPSNANDVGNNKNLTNFGESVGNTRGGAGGSSYWMWVDGGQHWIKWQFKDALQAKGVMNTAFIPDTSQVSGSAAVSAFFASLSADEYNNMWIYLSGDGPSYPNQITTPMGTHGTLYWFTFGIARLNQVTIPDALQMGADIVEEYPDGEFWMHMDIAVPPS